jgi:glycosyltransferase involved in cell wall biosynthesis
MRVLMLPKPEPEDGITSGIGRYVGIVERHLKADVEIVHLPGAPHAEDRPREKARVPGEIPDARLIHMRRWVPPVFKLITGYVGDTIRLARLIRPYRNKVDLIHVSHVGCEIHTIAAKLAGFRKVVATIHNLPGEGAWAEHWFRRLVERLSFACAAQLISVSQATYDAWRERIGLRNDKVTVIHNGMDISDTELPDKQEARHRFSIPENIFVFGICARLHPMKGHRVLLEAFARLIKERELLGCPVDKLLGESPSGSLPSATQQPSNSTTGLLLLIAGDGPEQANIEAKIKDLGLAGHVRMLGRIQDVMGFMRTLDVHLLPSVTLESLPFSVVEAMFAGVPSIVSDVGGAKEIVRGADGGLVVPKGNVEALANAMRYFSGDKVERDEAGQRSAAYAHSNLTGKLMAHETLAVYRKLTQLP